MMMEVISDAFQAQEGAMTSILNELFSFVNSKMPLNKTQKEYPGLCV